MRRIVPIVAAILAVVLAGAVAWKLARPTAPPAGAAMASDIGGPFQLVDDAGRPVTDRDLLGKPTLMFFGFTYCPEACPTTLAHMSAWMKALGPAADRFNYVFVSVDPERDTPAVLHKYLGAFDPRIRGLTGSPAAVAATAHAYRVFYQKVPQPGGGYTIDHSSMIYLMDAHGRFVAPIGYGEADNRVLPMLRALVEG